MSYVVLARKYRPRSFSEMVGQEHVVRALSNALAAGRLHHAYLFTGTRGIGKTTVSRILAKSLNCTGPDGTGGITCAAVGSMPGPAQRSMPIATSTTSSSTPHRTAALTRLVS
jgi:DNA polymerase-3 subunit gamma/tau